MKIPGKRDVECEHSIRALAGSNKRSGSGMEIQVSHSPAGTRNPMGMAIETV